jgi:hypothetical protein
MKFSDQTVDKDSDNRAETTERKLTSKFSSTVFGDDREDPNRNTSHKLEPGPGGSQEIEGKGGSGNLGPDVATWDGKRSSPDRPGRRVIRDMDAKR